jgi:hypothetical protein
VRLGRVEKGNPKVYRGVGYYGVHGGLAEGQESPWLRPKVICAG